jgi:hypothetical protein
MLFLQAFSATALVFSVLAHAGQTIAATHAMRHVGEVIRNVDHKVTARSGPAAYARAVRRYGFESPLWAARRGVVFRKHWLRSDGPSEYIPTESEVPAVDVQNGM